MANLKSKVCIMIGILMLSYLPLTKQVDDESTAEVLSFEEHYHSGGQNPQLASLIVDYEVVNLTEESNPIVWFKTTSLTEETYINISGFWYSWNNYISVEISAHTSYDQCVNSWFDVRYGSTNLCSNPSEDNVIYFVLDFSDTSSSSGTKIFEPISINISIGHKVSTNQGTVQDPAADGDLNSDSTQFMPVVRHLDSGNQIAIDGKFEGQNDIEYLRLTSHYQGTHQLTASIDGPVQFIDTGIDHCEYAYGNGVSTRYSQFFNIDSLESFKNGYVFTASTTSLNNALWYTSDFDVQPTLLMDMSASQYQYASILTITADEIYFQAYSSQSGYELWKSDGTPSGTMLVADIASGSASSNPNLAIEHAGKIYFIATTSQTGQEIWATNGSASGTYLVSDVRTGYSGSNPSHLTSYSGSLYFSARNIYGEQHIWKSDGLENGDTNVIFESLNNYGTYPTTIFAHNGLLYFIANSQTEGRELWSTDGTSGNINQLTDTYDYGSTSIAQIHPHGNGNLYFLAKSDYESYWKYWTTDGSTPGTAELTLPNLDISGTSEISKINDELYLMPVYQNNGTLDVFRVPTIGTGIDYVATLPEHTNGEYYYSNSELITHDGNHYISFGGSSNHLYNLYKINENSKDSEMIDTFPLYGISEWMNVDGTLHTIPSSAGRGLFDFDSSLANNPITTEITCTIHSSTMNYQFYPISRDLYDGFSLNPQLIIDWSVGLKVEPISAIEDSRTGDSMRASIPTPLSSNGNLLGNFHTSNDVDYYAVPIEHGSLQRIDIDGKYPLSLSMIGTHSCEISSEQDTISSVFPYSSTIECDTTTMSDEIVFALGSTQYPYMKPSNHYRVSTSYESLEAFANYSTDYTIPEDIPSVGSNTILQKGTVTEGTFFLASDTIDQYIFDISEEDYIRFELLSNCATIKSQKTSYAEYVSFSPFQNSGSHLIVDNVDPDNPIYSIEVERLYQSSITEPHRKERCDYSLKYDDVPESELPASQMNVVHEHRLSLGETINYASFESAHEGIYTHTASSYRMTLPIDLSPIKHGKIVASQSSGEPVEMMIYSSVGSLSTESEQIIGQNINVGMDYVQWTSLHLTNLDGSDLTVSMIEASSIQSSTRESSELFSRGIGSLGMSADEGYDTYDTWIVNNSDQASFYSIELRETATDLDASFSYYGRQMSVLSCGNQLNNNLYLDAGSGDYEIELKKSYTSSCPIDFQINAPSTISPDSNFRAKFESGYVDDVNFELVDENFSIVYSATGILEDVWHPFYPESEMKPGHYYLIARNSDAVIVGEHHLLVTSEPSLGVSKSDSRLQLDRAPKIHISASNVHTNEPREWVIEDMMISGYDDDFEPFMQAYEDSFEGVGNEVIVLDEIPDLLSGSQFQVHGNLTSGDSIRPFMLIWQVEFLQTSTNCESEFLYDSANAHNQMLCLVSLQSMYHGMGWSSSLAEQVVDGEMNIHNATGEIVLSLPFTTDRFSPTPIRVNIPDLEFWGNYTTTLSFEDESIFFTESSALFTASGYLGEDVQVEDQISDFDLSILSIRNTATQGDTVNILWEVNGQDVNYLVADIYVNGAIVYSVTEAVDDRDGTLELELPESVNPYNDHQITIRAISEFGEIDTEFTTVQGLPEQTQLLVEIQPTKPTIGEAFKLNIVNPNGEDWMSWRWQLSVSGSIISSDEGFDEDDEVSTSVTLPVSQYTSNPVLEVWIETIDGNVEERTLVIDPMPMRSVAFVLDGDLVKGEETEFDWELQGIYLNTMDDIQLIEVRMYSMSFDLVHKQQYSTNDDRGQEEILLPDTILPGTYNLVVEFTFADGTTYEHIQTAQVLESPNGITFLGLTIPPLAMGLDTILVLGLLIHAIVIHVWMRRREDAPKEDLDDELEDDETIEDEYNFLEQYDGVETNTVDQYTHVQQSFNLAEETKLDLGIDKSNPDLYQEYPVGSGRFWYRNTPTDEWTQVDG